MKIFLPSLFILAAAFSSYAAQEDPSVLKARLDILEAKRELSLKEMAKLRQDLIRKDPSLRKIHERIIAEHRKLALLLDSKKEIHEMNGKLLKLDSEIQEIKMKMENEQTKAPLPAAPASPKAQTEPRKEK